MVQVVVIAKNPADGFLRDWQIKADSPPTAGVWQNEVDVEQHHQGDQMTKDLNLSDGKHDIYFIVSQTGGPALGTYSGQIQFDGAASNFSGVNELTAAKFVVDVKGNKVLPTSAPAGGSDWMQKLQNIWTKYHNPIIIGSTGIALASTVVLVAKKKITGRL